MPSRLSHSNSDGVKGRGAAEVACLGFCEELDSEAEFFPPVGVEGFAMFLAESLKRRKPKRKGLTIATGAHGGRQENASAATLDVASKVGEGSPKTDVIVDEKVRATGDDRPVESRLES